jgi:hypothetical protein
MWAFVKVHGGEASEKLVAAAGAGAEAHISVNYFIVVALLSLEVEKTGRGFMMLARLSRGVWRHRTE